VLFSVLVSFLTSSSFENDGRRRMPLAVLDGCPGHQSNRTIRNRAVRLFAHIHPSTGRQGVYPERSRRGDTGPTHIHPSTGRESGDTGPTHIHPNTARLSRHSFATAGQSGRPVCRHLPSIPCRQHTSGQRKKNRRTRRSKYNDKTKALTGFTGYTG
jgi:hypothetical protein